MTLTDMPEILLTTKDLAQRWQMKEQTLRHWRMRGEGPRALTVGRLVRFRLEDVESWEAANLEAEADR